MYSPTELQNFSPTRSLLVDLVLALNAYRIFSSGDIRLKSFFFFSVVKCIEDLFVFSNGVQTSDHASTVKEPAPAPLNCSFKGNSLWAFDIRMREAVMARTIEEERSNSVFLEKKWSTAVVVYCFVKFLSHHMWLNWGLPHSGSWNEH